MDETPDTAVFDFRQAAEVGIVDVVLQDVNSSLKPSGSSAVGVSSVISSSSQMTAFVDIATSCHDFALLGYYYCRSICFRSVTFATSPSGTERFVLRVTDNSNPERTFDFPGTYNLELEVTDGQSPEIRNTWILKHRYFAPSVPDGSYTAQFIDGSSGQVVWPTFVESRIEHHTCSSPLISNPVKIEMPSPTELQCRQLVRNGDMESSNSNYPFWLHAETGIALVDGAGIGGTNAISDTVHTINHAYIGQFIDTRCLEIGRRYNARAWVKLVNPSTNVLIICDKEDSTCPSVVLRYRTPGEPTGQSFVEGAHTVAFKIVDQNDGWSLFEATVTIDSSIAGAESVALVVRRGMANVKMYLDNVSMSLLT